MIHCGNGAKCHEFPYEIYRFGGNDILHESMAQEAGHSISERVDSVGGRSHYSLLWLD